MGDQGRAGPDINGVGYSPPVVTVIGPGGRDVQNPTCILGLATSRRSIERNWERKGRFVLWPVYELCTCKTFGSSTVLEVDESTEVVVHVTLRWTLFQWPHKWRTERPCTYHQSVELILSFQLYFYGFDAFLQIHTRGLSFTTHGERTSSNISSECTRRLSFVTHGEWTSSNTSSECTRRPVQKSIGC